MGRLSLVVLVVLGMLGLVPVAASAAPPSCPVSITHDTTLHADLDCTGVTSGIAVSIDKAGVTLDLNGFSINGPTGSDSTTGVYTEHNNVSVVNGTIADFDTGLEFYGAFHGTAKKLTVTNDASDSYPTGIYVEYGGKNHIRLNSIDTQYYGLYLYGSSENAVTRNHITNPAAYSSYAYGGYGEYEFGDRWVRNTVDMGSAATYVYGIEDDYSQKDVFRSNSSTGGYEGLYLDCDSYGTVTALNNNTSQNPGDGIYIIECYNDYGSPGSSLIRGNTANGNGADGLYDDFSLNARFINNTANNNGDYGINIDYPESDVIVGNHTDGNQSDSGMYLEDNESLYQPQSLRNNSANGNSNYGIYADYGVPASRSSGNTAHGNPSDNCFNVVCSS